MATQKMNVLMNQQISELLKYKVLYKTLLKRIFSTRNPKNFLEFSWKFLCCFIFFMSFYTITKLVGCDLNAHCSPYRSRFYRPLASAICIPTNIFFFLNSKYILHHLNLFVNTYLKFLLKNFTLCILFLSKVSPRTLQLLIKVLA